MKISISCSISTILFLLTATTLAQNATQDFQIQCSRFPPMIVGNLTFNPAAITDLSQALSANSFTPKLPAEGITLGPGKASPFGFPGNGGYQICVRNLWFFKTLTVPLSNLGQIVAQFGTQCCADSSGNGGPPGVGGRRGVCQDARGLVPTTEEGTGVQVVAQDFGDLCCGLWGCS